MLLFLALGVFLNGASFSPLFFSCFLFLFDPLGGLIAVLIIASRNDDLSGSGTESSPD